MTAEPAATIVIAHRGASGYLPEHTLPAKALAHAMGADFIEQDVVLTRDGIPIVLHDIYLETTTDVATCFPDRARRDGRYYAIDFSLAEIRQLRAHERSSFDSEGVEHAVYSDRFPLGPGILGVPTLAEEIDLIAGLDHSRKRCTGLYIELKAPRFHREAGHDIAGQIVAVLESRGYASRSSQVYLQSFDSEVLRYLKFDLRSPLPLIQLLAENAWNEANIDFDFLRTEPGLDQIASYAAGIGPWLEHIYLGKDASGKPQFSDLVASARHRGLMLHPFTFRRDDLPPGIANFEELLEIFITRLQVDGVFTDFPDIVRHYIDGGRNPR